MSELIASSRNLRLIADSYEVRATRARYCIEREALLDASLVLRRAAGILKGGAEELEDEPEPLLPFRVGGGIQQ